ncbi:MAG: efflux RND transporter permease subunit [Clostridiales bacterium]|nr:efflux RND transporter permease subunit [Clostridiales bacterium]
MIKTSVKKPFTIFVAVILIIILGIVAYSRMVPDLFPKMDLPYVVVITPYPGSTPEKVENDINKPLERSFVMLENVENVQSTANSSYSVITIEFNEKANIDNVVVDILEDINMVSGQWDEMVGTSTILKLNPSMIPISVMAVEYEGKTQAELSAFLEDELLDSIEGTTGVASVGKNGLLKESLMVSINQDKIDELNDKVLSDIDGKIAAGRREITTQKSKVDQGLSKTKEGKEEIQGGLDQVTAGLIGVQVSKSILTLGGKLNNENFSEGVTGAITENGLPIDPNVIISQYTTYKNDLNGTEQQLLQTKTFLEDSKQKLTTTETALTTAQSELGKALDTIDAEAKTARENANLGDKITVEMVANLLKAQNFDMPAGYIGESKERYLVSVGDKVESLDAIKNLLLMSIDIDSVGDVKLSDVADVYIEDNSSMSYANLNGNPSVLLMVSKQSNYPTAEVSTNLKAKIIELTKEYEGLNVISLMDQGDYIRLMISSILKSLLFGAIFAVIILLIFLREIKPTLITIVSIPTSMMFAIFLMYMFGVSINIVSISGLAVAVGMIVDNSVVVIENISRLRSEGVPLAKASYAGAKQVAGAITASTLTTVSVFVPIIFIQGLTKQLFSDMAITVTVALIASLIIGLTLVPAMSIKMLKNTIPKKIEEGKVKLKYRSSLKWVLNHKAIILIAATILLFFSTVSILSKGFIFMPEMNSPQVGVQINYPDETTYDEMEEKTDSIIEKISTIEGVSDVGTMMGSGGMDMAGSKSDYSNVTMYAMIDQSKGISSLEIEKEINKLKYPKDSIVKASGSDISDFTTAMGGEGINIEIKGSDLTELQESAKIISEELKSVEGIDEIDDGLEDSEAELHFVVNKKKAIDKGLMVASVYAAISQKINNSITATDVDDDTKNYEIVVMEADNADMNREELEEMVIEATSITGEKTNVLLKDVTDIEERETLNSINRKNQNRIITVSATLQEGYNITLTTSKAMKAIEKIELPKGMSIEFHGENETVMDGIRKLTMMLALGILFIYLIMVAQFQSLKSPFIIMFTIPLAMTGGFIGLLITGNVLSVVAMIGLVMLVGIIVNNGIVLVDYVNQLRARGHKKRDALIEAGVTRMRPILMTSLTTICGLIVLALGRDMGTEMMQPVAIVCIGGLVYATFMTLYIVPCIYDFFNKEEYKFISDEELDISDIIV